MNKQFCAKILAIIAVSVSPSLSFGQVKIASNEAAASVVEIRNVTEANNAITGEVVNKSFYNLRNIELLLQYHWLWTNEMHPGANSPGPIGVLKPRQGDPTWQARNVYLPSRSSPLPVRPDGRYVSEVSLAGFSQATPQPGS